MAGVRALPDLVSRITVDTTGLKAAEAQARLSGAGISSGLGTAGKSAKAAEQDVAGLEKRMGAAGLSTGRWTTLLGGGAGLNPALLAAGVAAAGLVIAGKSVLDISEKWEAAQLGLAQATKEAGVSTSKARAEVDAFIQSNRRFVKDQSEVVDAYASLTRSGLKETEVQRDLNIALDLAALKHIDLSEAVGLVVKAEHGRMRGLIDLGITSAKYTDVNGNLIVANHSVAQSMAELEAKVKSGRQATTQLTQAQNELGNAWQDLSRRAGPPLLTMLTKLTQATADLFAQDSAARDETYTVGFGPFQHKVKNPYAQHRAGGGAVVPGGIYTVGERGPETLVMGSRGGTVIPNSGRGGASGNTFNLHVHGTDTATNPDDNRRMLQRMAFIGLAT